jgi:hypothetical protein
MKLQWQYNGKQNSLFIEAFAMALAAYGSKLKHISTIEFAWIQHRDADAAMIMNEASQLGIAIKFSKRNPAEKLDGEEKDLLPVLSYAWDGNAFPGNEYWVGSLSASGDPAAASMSTISELHNPLINPNFLQRIQVLSPTDD